MSRLTSIIIPCFNGADHVSDAVHSALAQTHPDCEVIVVDDGSTDGTTDILRRFGHAIRWVSQPNSGACAARNRGLEMSKGELVQFLDADDLLHPEKVQRQIEASEAEPGNVVVSDGEVIRGELTSIESYGRGPWHDSVQLALGTGFSTPGPLHLKHVLKRIRGFREDLPCAQERDLHLRLAASGVRFVHLPLVLWTQRRRSGSLSSDNMKVLDQHLRIVMPVYRQLLAQGQLTDDRARAFAGLLARDARVYFRAGNTERGVDYLRHARSMHSEGGLRWAYSKLARCLLRVFGPVIAERIAGWKRYMPKRLISEVAPKRT